MTSQEQSPVDRSKEQSPLDRWWFAVALFLTLAAAIVALWWFLTPWLGAGLKIEERALHGDSYGSVNALFTGLALAGIVYTILQQQREIRLQRRDFAAQLAEMREARREAAEQSRSLKLQSRIQLLDVLSRAAEIEAKGEELEARGWSANSAPHKAIVDRIKKSAAEIRDDVTSLQTDLESDA